MRLLPLYLFLLFFVPNVNGQTYFSSTPVDKGSYIVPAYIAGNWKEQKNMDAGKTYTVLVNPNQPGQLQIVPNYGVMSPGILSLVNNRIYVSIYEAGGREQPEGYYIYRLSVTNEKEVKLTPLRTDLQVPKGKNLKDFLATTDTSTTESGYAIWLSNVYKSGRQPAERGDRQININSKK